MNCRRCGRNNSPNARYCTYCGAPLSMPSKKNNQKQTESVIVALIIVLVLLLVIVAGVIVYKHNNSHNKSFGGGGGGGYLPPPSFVTETESAPQTESNDDTDETVEETIPAPQEQEDSYYNEKIAKKNEFLRKADDIEWYSQNYLETAQSQYELNSESSIVYKKWDALLNEVYRYLKTIMSESEFEQLQEDELDWITEKENAIDAAGAEWEGGSGEPMARNLAAIQYTEERCYYLISLIN